MRVVYHANYFRWFEQGRTELMADKGICYANYESLGYGLPVVEAGIRFQSPAFYNDTLQIVTTIEWLKKSTIQFCYKIYRAQEPALLVKGFTKHANINQQKKITPFPTLFSKNLHQDEGNQATT